MDPAHIQAAPIQDNTGRSRFELTVDGYLVFADYRRQGASLIIDWVEAAWPLRGTGAADKLMRGIVERARREGWTITPRCGYAATWLRRHREHRDLLA